TILRLRALPALRRCGRVVARAVAQTGRGSSGRGGHATPGSDALAAVCRVVAPDEQMLKNIHLWLPGYIARSKPRDPISHVFFCFVDHFEPLWNKASRHQGLERVEHWFENYPRMAEKFRDADGRPPQHTFFYPAEEYVPEYLDLLARL